MIYDIIGDIHGHADELEKLLLKLGYATARGFYHHKSRMAIFVGDLIDRGTQNRRVIEVVRGMVENGAGRAVMGNHEYNAICYHTRKPGLKSDWLRPHSKKKFKQHEKFLQEYPLGHKDTLEVIEWFEGLPLFIDDENLPFRVIHGCWDRQAVHLAKGKYLHDDNTLAQKYLVESAFESEDPGSPFTVIERLLKGVEVRLPEVPKPVTFEDKYGNVRNHIRVKWWGDAAGSFRELAFGYDGNTLFSLPEDQYPDCSQIPFYSKTEVKPVFFGHYWMTGSPVVQRDNVCCVDYSAGNEEKLVCYSLSRQEEGNRLNEKNFTWVECENTKELASLKRETL